MQVRQDNGYFDSRVLSRNHALLSCNPKNGAIYIKDLKSSNGTFVNGDRIDQRDKELNVGDVLDLGTDIDTKFEHRKISAFVEDIHVLPLIPTCPEVDPREDISFVEDVDLSLIQRAAFETSLFGDTDNIELEETIFGTDTEVLSGIFINNSIGTSSNLTNTIKSIASDISLRKYDYTKLRGIESFLVNYTASLDYSNKLILEKNDHQLMQLQNDLRKKLSEEQDVLMAEHQQRINEIESAKAELKRSIKRDEKRSKDEISGIEMELEDLKTRLEVETFKNAQLTKENKSLEDAERLQEEEMSKLKRTDNIDKEVKKSRSHLILFTLGAVSLGILAFTLRYIFRSYKCCLLYTSRCV